MFLLIWFNFSPTWVSNHLWDEIFYFLRLHRWSLGMDK